MSSGQNKLEQYFQNHTHRVFSESLFTIWWANKSCKSNETNRTELILTTHYIISISRLYQANFKSHNTNHEMIFKS